MPSFECTFKLRAADRDTVLNLTSRHCLVHMDSDTSTSAKKLRFPENVAIVPAPTIVFSLSAVLNRKRLATDVLINSQLAQHFVDFLRANADQLGLSFVSKLYIAEDAGSCLSINVRTNHNRIPFHDNMPVRLTLRAVHLQYSVTTSKESDYTLFSPRLSLPYQSLVDNILKRFITFHLVKKYPLVFGALCQQLDIEALYFSSIFRSIHEMAQRSRNPAFRPKYKQLIKMLKKQQEALYTSSSTALTAYLDENDADAKDVVPSQLSNEAAFCLSMERLFCIGIKRRTFKTTPVLPMTNMDIHDDDELLRDYSIASADHPGSGETSLALPPEIPPTLSYKEAALWDDCSEHDDNKRMTSTRTYNPESFDSFEESFLAKTWAADDSLATKTVVAAKITSVTTKILVFDSDADDDDISPKNQSYGVNAALGNDVDEIFSPSLDSELFPSRRSPNLSNSHQVYPKNLEPHTLVFSDVEREIVPPASTSTLSESSLTSDHDMDLDPNFDVNIDMDTDRDMTVDVARHTSTQSVSADRLSDYDSIAEIDQSNHIYSDVLDIDSDVNPGSLSPSNNFGHDLEIDSGKPDELLTIKNMVDQYIIPSDDETDIMDLYAANSPYASSPSISASTFSIAPLASSAPLHIEYGLAAYTIDGCDRCESPPLDFFDGFAQEQHEDVAFAFAFPPQILNSDLDEADINDNALQLDFDSDCDIDDILCSDDDCASRNENHGTGTNVSSSQATL
ncbi:hypothetical protein J3R30DRAFT_2101008 [Lentinula aciculospora]|uniref:Uncharacterized protein n=1 Tax=Lentinula aciculospora TaxID=153920 RepID=A0A9W9AHD9_9AGAR|nr:hypothetical protein J3R30DRAFT_2101008 [Lentinula aciculospora]